MDTVHLAYTLKDVYRNHDGKNLVINPENKIPRFAACPYCAGKLLDDDSNYAVCHEGLVYSDWSRVCLGCKWKVQVQGIEGMIDLRLGILQEFSPILSDDVKDEILRIFHSESYLYQINPTQFEIVIAQALSRMLGVEAIHVGRSGDGGVDAILIDTEGQKTLVQVKRRTKKSSVESVSTIRELRGAMVVKGQNKGMVVSTAERFSPQANLESTYASYHSVEQRIELIDCRRLLDILNLVAVY